LYIPRTIEGRKHSRREFGGLFQHRIGDIGCDVVEARELRERIEIRQLAQHELHVGERCLIVVHGRTYMLRR